MTVLIVAGCAVAGGVIGVFAGAAIGAHQDHSDIPVGIVFTAGYGAIIGTFAGAIAGAVIGG